MSANNNLTGQSLLAVVEIDEEYTKNIIINSLTKYGIKIITKEEELAPRNEQISLVQFKEYEYIDFENALKENSKSQYKLTNCYCIRKGLIRKAQLCYILNKYSIKNNLKLNFYPQTWYFELDYIENLEELLIDELYDFKNEILNTNNYYCLKASFGNRGNYIEVFNSLDQLNEILENIYSENEDSEGSSLREWIIQKVIHPPLLIQTKKFHIRTYIVLSKNVKVYLFRDMLALFSTKQYKINDKKAFITNTCYQNENNNKAEENVKLLFEINELKHKKEEIYEKIKKTIIKVIEAILTEPIMFQFNKKSFELFGLDFILDSNYHVFFLEANAFPDLKQSGYQLKTKIQKLFDLIVETIVLETKQNSNDFELILEKNRFN